MTTITKELNLLDIEDIEEALSTHFGKRVSVSEVTCWFVYHIPFETEIPSRMDLEFSLNGERPFEGLFWDRDKGGHYWKGKRLALNEPWLPIEEVFNFDTAVFESFYCCTETLC